MGRIVFCPHFRNVRYYIINSNKVNSMTKVLLFGNSVIVLGFSLNTIGLGITIGPGCFSLTLLFLSIIIEDVNDSTVERFKKAKEKYGR